MEEILQKRPECEFMFLVGGFAESELLERKIKTCFEREPGRLMFKPHRPGTAVVQGALKFEARTEVSLHYKRMRLCQIC